MRGGADAARSFVSTEELARIDQTGQRQWLSLVLCIKGDALLAAQPPDDTEAERCYHEAIEVARAQIR